MRYVYVTNCFLEIVHKVVNLQAELSYLQAHLSSLEVPTPPPPPPQPIMAPPQLSISDLPTASSVPATYDLSSLFDPMVQPLWAVQQQQHHQHQRGPMDQRSYGSADTRGPSIGSSSGMGGGGGDLQSVAREFLHRHGSPSIGHMHDPSPSSSMSKWYHI